VKADALLATCPLALKAALSLHQCPPHPQVPHPHVALAFRILPLAPVWIIFPTQGCSPRIPVSHLSYPTVYPHRASPSLLWSWNPPHIHPRIYHHHLCSSLLPPKLVKKHSDFISPPKTSWHPALLSSRKEACRACLKKGLLQKAGHA